MTEKDSRSYFDLHIPSSLRVLQKGLWEIKQDQIEDLGSVLFK